MGIEAITQSDTGNTVIPSNDEEWITWVAATKTRNFLLQDPLLDWLELYGDQNGFCKDNEYSSYDSRTDFSEFTYRKANEFENVVARYLEKQMPLVKISQENGDIRDLTKAQDTFKAMKDGVPIIYQAVLRNAESCTYGSPDILIRSDQFQKLFPNAISKEIASRSAPALEGKPWHYRVIDIKYTTLELLADNFLGNSGSNPAYKAQLFIYNRALGRLQDYLPEESYLLGRGWRQQIKGGKIRGSSAIERLAPILQTNITKKGSTLEQTVQNAINWIRLLRKEGGSWRVIPDPVCPELRPNMGNQEDAPWHTAKQHIAVDLEDLTLLWKVGPDKRAAANSKGIERWTDPKCTPSMVGITGEIQAPVLQKILDINQSTEGPNVSPPNIKAEDHLWRDIPALEFYVDFETVSDLDDDFSDFPEKGGQPLIFMIGCGHMENEHWQFRCFIADSLTEQAEARIIDEWLDYMSSVQNKISPDNKDPIIFHWSPAEVSSLEKSYNATVKRHPDKNWRVLRWFDFLKHVIRKEPVVVRGALNFGLKTVAKAMFSHCNIETNWEDGPADGLGAMVGTWWCANEATNLGVNLIDIDLMKEIQKYNEVDCRVMMEIIGFLRKYH